MEDVLVSAVLSPVLETLRSLAVREFAIAWGLKADLDKLKNTSSTIQAVLRDAEQKQWKNEAVKIWLKRLKVAAEEAEDVIDEFYAQAAIRKVKRESGLLHRAGTYFSLPNRLLFRLKLGERILEVNGKLGKIAKDRVQFHLTPNLEVDYRHNATRETSSQVVESKIFGRGDEKEKLVDALLFQNGSSETDSSLFVYAIYGMGGVGKTTLARLVFNELRMDKEFKFKIWICVSEDFGTGRLIRAMLESIEGRGSDIQSLDVLQRRLEEKISGSKFMLVLDDVWNEDARKWDDLKDVLMTCGGRGSIVIVTTRIQKIATLMASANCIYYLDRLSEDDSWSLFQQSVGAKETENFMETMGKTMLIKCHGVPLAVKALGGLMRTKNGEDEWRSIMETEIWNARDVETSIFSTLRFSYDHLSPHMRKCFTYCSVFPKDFEMSKDDLIHLWMANGFIPPSKHSHWYNVGEDIFCELGSRSFIQDITEVPIEGTRCKVHDLMHDLASRMASGECFSSETQNLPEISKEVRHLHCDMGNSTKQKKVFSARFPLLRSLLLIFPDAPVVSNVSTLPAVETNHLRALYAPRCCKEVPRTIKCRQLIHLRYLNLSYSDIEVLPESIIYLQNLQTLNLRECRSLRELPKNLKYLKNLGFLDIRGCFPFIIPDITQLKTQQLMVNGLSLMMGVGDHSSDLMEINPCGDLELGNLQNIRNPEEAKRANLKSKRNVQNLTLDWEWFMEREGSMSSESEGIMEALQPHPNLQYLGIQNYPGSTFPNWLIDLRLRSLTALVLMNIEKCQHLPPLEKLPFLESLMLSKMHSVKYIVSELFNEGEDVKLFPSLKTLFLEDMPSLVGWSTMDGMGRLLFPLLCDVEIVQCQHLPPLEKLPSLETLLLKKMHSVKYIVSELFNEGEDVKLFPSLKTLFLEDMPSLVGWSTMDGMGRLLFPILRTVKIVQCQHLPPLEKLPSLETLLLKKMHSVKYIVSELYNKGEDVKLFPSLKTLHLEDLPSLVGWSTMDGMGRLLFPQLDRALFVECQLDWLTLNELSPSLEELYFKSCDLKKFPEEGLENLKSLSLLYIESCPNLVSLPAIAMQGLPSLNMLCIYDCLKFVSLPEDLKHLTSLRFLNIENCPEMKTLPEEGLRHLNALNMLYFGCCQMLSSLPDCIGDLSSLWVMEISFCPCLVSLPDGLRKSTSLQKLNIRGCPQLDRRCKKNRGEDWPKIAHIPHVWIDTRLITESSDIDSVTFDEYAFRMDW